MTWPETSAWSSASSISSKGMVKVGDGKGSWIWAIDGPEQHMMNAVVVRKVRMIAPYDGSKIGV
ncbi:protein of unknown function [Nitrospira japonica]|uniref:Uncharacterized protein n=1 Tax=Nitrospira japonica TaxID=1325564 RepID=A0A1W1I7N9_9BACT|nr:protein of unknown function [Nitrospira japonica]